jgi:hypothetical protein
MMWAHINGEIEETLRLSSMIPCLLIDVRSLPVSIVFQVTIRLHINAKILVLLIKIDGSADR